MLKRQWWQPTTKWTTPGTAHVHSLRHSRSRISVWWSTWLRSPGRSVTRARLGSVPMQEVGTSLDQSDHRVRHPKVVRSSRSPAPLPPHGRRLHRPPVAAAGAGRWSHRRRKAVTIGDYRRSSPPCRVPSPAPGSDDRGRRCRQPADPRGVRCSIGTSLRIDGGAALPSTPLLLPIRRGIGR